MKLLDHPPAFEREPIVGEGGKEETNDLVVTLSYEAPPPLSNLAGEAILRPALSRSTSRLMAAASRGSPCRAMS